MPNWTYNRLEVSSHEGQGALIDAFLAKHINDDGAFDFSTVISPPEGFNGELSAGSNDDAAEVLDGEPRTLAKYFSYPWVRDAGITDHAGLVKLLTDRYESSVKSKMNMPDIPGFNPYPFETYAELAAAYRKNVEVSGFKNWYEWACNEWGTKWNAGDTTVTRETPERVVLYFNTAWCEPVPVLHALFDQWPLLKFQSISEHEGGENDSYHSSNDYRHFMSR